MKLPLIKWHKWTFVGESKSRKFHYTVECECGFQRDVNRYSLFDGASKMCMNCRNERLSTHKMTDLRPYGIWENMKQRCYNRNQEAYKYYGGRGIGICDRWMHFSNFWEDMKDGYFDGATIDRIDHSDNYHLQNCRWVTRQENSGRTRLTTSLEYKGKSNSISGWAREFGMKRPTLDGRLRKGWSLSKALETPVSIRSK